MKKYKLGYTQGTFDMFHIGHLNLLHQASALCDTLIVGVNSDQLVNEYKHKTPMVSERDRAAIVGELRCVDKVVLCDTLSKTEAWQRLHFDAVFIGSDWKGNERWQQTERDSKYTLLGSVEVDEGFFPTEIPDKQKNEPLKRGAGSQAKTKVLVMAESTEVDSPKKDLKPQKVGHIKMVVIPDSKKETIDPIASTGIDGDAAVVSDGTKSHINFPKMFSEYVGRKIDSKEVGKVLPWVHIAISNSKSLMKNIYHGIKPEFLQEYLNEFCYKFNRRYFGYKLFDRLMIASIACTSEFEHRIYNRNLSAGCG